MDANDLAFMRDSVEALLPDTAIIQALTRSSDGAGGWSETWAAVSGGTVACRIDPARSQNSGIITVPGREGMLIDYQGTFPHDAPLAVNRRVVVGSNTYEIVSLAIDHSWNVSARAMLTRIV